MTSSLYNALSIISLAKQSRLTSGEKCIWTLKSKKIVHDKAIVVADQLSNQLYVVAHEITSNAKIQSKFEYGSQTIWIIYPDGSDIMIICPHLLNDDSDFRVSVTAGEAMNYVTDEYKRLPEYKTG